MKMKIVKLPDKINPNHILKEKIDEINSVCPFCGESGINAYSFRTYFKRLPQDKFKFWKKRLHLRIDSWNCGGEWETDPYPQNLGGVF